MMNQQSHRAPFVGSHWRVFNRRVMRLFETYTWLGGALWCMAISAWVAFLAESLPSAKADEGSWAILMVASVLVLGGSARTFGRFLGQRSSRPRTKVGYRVALSACIVGWMVAVGSLFDSWCRDMPVAPFVDLAFWIVFACGVVLLAVAVAERSVRARHRAIRIVTPRKLD